ncbi:DUF3861 domain-containing protein [Formosa sp. S-31]|uniref:DUF3861 domain-containing protein n=1 Tax=Formosa sp. S-31 TaxID=2790949 RepID=UPI003EC0B087
MTKKVNTYKLTLEQVDLHDKDLKTSEPLSFEFENHDEIFEIIKKMKSKNIFKSDKEATEFALGLKLFSEVMVKNRDHKIFKKLLPVFGKFMKKLKKYK